ncbi:reverse transcriptase domain-containing protein [Tanacetum coccineum]|uniref:Reverse transcriptase domain-containing protein n=1 Tax=Tanacetum coccineum TaxID=301880 RepID=A0ABQ4Y0P0_9ASTR
MIPDLATQTPVVSQLPEVKINVANPSRIYPGTDSGHRFHLTKNGRKELCVLLKQNLDIFAWKPADMTGVPRSIAEHRLNIREGYSPVRQKKRGQAPERNKAIQEEGRNVFRLQVRPTGESLVQDKADAVLSLPSPRCIKDVQKLNGKLASLNRFLSKSAEKSLPFFKTLKNCTKKSDFQWTPEAEEAFKQMKKLIAELPTLTAPREREELIIYLAAAKEAISAVLMTDREGRQIPVYFVSRTLRGPEVNYTPMEKLVLALLSASKRLKRYFQAHTTGSSCVDGRGRSDTGQTRKGQITYAMRFRFEATNNEAEYEALIAGLRIAEQMGVKNLQANVDSRLVANQVNGFYTAKESGMKLRGRNISFGLRKEVKIGGKNFRSPMVTYNDSSSNGENTILVNIWHGSGHTAEIRHANHSLRTAEIDQAKNNEALGINLDLIEEKREQAAIQEAKSKKKMEKYYNSRVRGTSFKPGDMVYRSNEASHAQDGGKLGPKWEGPYEVKESLGKGAYKLKDRKGNDMPRTWNICNLKKCYIHEM